MSDASSFDGLDQASREALVRLAIRGMARGPLAPEIQQLIDRDFALTKGPILMPTPAGMQAAGVALRLPAGSEQERQVRGQFEKFLPVNHRLRELCTAWQRRPDGSANEHDDATYDAAVRDDLDDVDAAIGRILRRLSEVVPHLGHYREQLTAALEKLDDGDTSALTSPLTASYHTVWMWLHQELLLLLGISRAEDDRLEKQLVAGHAR